MIDKINYLAEKMGLNTRNRAIYAKFSNEILNSQIVVQSVSGVHFINDEPQYELLCLSLNAQIPLKTFSGCQVAVDIVTDLGELSRFTGIVSKVTQGATDGAICVYKLVLQDAFSLLKLTQNSRVFRNIDVIGITKILIEEALNKSSLLKAALKLDLSGIEKQYDTRPFVMMYNESIYQFLTRLWRSEGINWLISETDLKVANPAQDIQAQKLSLIDHNSHFSSLSRKIIRFHSRSDATERFDTITSLSAERQIQSNRIQSQRWVPDGFYQDQENSVLTKHKHSENFDSDSLDLEQVWNLAPAWIDSSNEQLTSSSSAQLSKLNQQLIQYQDLQAKKFIAKSSVRDADVGYCFELVGHFELNSHASSDRQMLILGKKFYHQNNLPKDLKNQIDALIDLSHWQYLKINSDEMHGAELSLVRRNTIIVPAYDPLKHRPQVYPMRGKVVGPSGEQIHVNAYGDVKVRFLFTRSADHQHASGHGANDSDQDSFWLPVLTLWAGSEGEGTRFHPRVGDEVCINFFEGDIDRPFVAGSIYESQHHQTNFDKKGEVPATKKISGIRSREVDGEGFNQLRFDDSTGQISAQLQSSHAATQLNLGNLSHPKESETSKGRGEGFELRTDAYGAVRAAKGMLLTTYAQEQAIAEHLDAVQAQSLLNQAHESMKMLSEIAVKQQTDALNVINRLPKLIQSLEIKSVTQALQTTLNLFKEGIVNDPLNALKDCAGFIQDIGQIGGGGIAGIVDEFNGFFQDAKGAVDNLKGFIENVEDFGTDFIKNELKNIKNEIKNDPFSALTNVASTISKISLDDFDLTSVCGAMGGGSGQLSGLLNSFQGFMQNKSQDKQASSDSESNGKLFRQALMLFASPNGIAMTTPEDILSHAGQEIGLSSGGSMNISSQKNIVMHAQGKYSAFAVNGISVVAANQNVEIQAQNALMKLIARMGIQVISTEGKIEITSAVEINLKAGGSNIVINKQGIHHYTNALFEVKSGQHLFSGPQSVNAELPNLPKIGQFSNRWDFYELFYTHNFANVKYKIINKQENSYIQGYLDEYGRTERIDKEENQEYDILIGASEYWSIENDEIVGGE
ncbi:type VI secretion system Vgr family protein [Acinetobacter gerneri]|jgi:type VI secretion system VgrG family protein|uniref:type VI secretion system Vgr family protein n=1 Tax=Acinetobacter gerneri TaxID=202952 RepID=UPI0023F3C8B9|nr:type VI secretion system Vgr family protein [Acinetobacter gerneri]MCH4245234.1 type VI secretion system tip protein VgrG [Acinetobacter gerneri]